MATYKIALAGLILATAALAVARDDKRPYALMVGDAPPKITVSKWVKGTPVKEFEAGKTYVVEFWATWCGPCKVSIPHLTELQKKNPNVKFVGVSVWENSQADVEPFVKEMGAKMNYTVAMDKIAEPGAKSDTGAMAKGWMAAAGQNGIPTAFIVNDKRVVWIGHPMMMEDTLDQVVAGKWDADAFAKKYAEKRASEAAMASVSQKIGEAFQKRDWTGFNAGLKEAFDGPAHNDDQILNSLVWPAVMPKSPVEKPDLDLMQQMMERAVEVNNRKDFASLDTLARVYFLKGDKAKAAATEKEAIAAAPADQKADLEKTLKEYGG